MQTTFTSTIIEQDNYVHIVQELDSFVVAYNKIKRCLYKDIISYLVIHKISQLPRDKINNLKSSYQLKYKINARHFNSIYTELMGQIQSVLELNKSYILSTQDKIESLSKSIKSKQKNLNLLLKVHAKKESLSKVDKSNLTSLKTKLYYLNLKLASATEKLNKLQEIEATGNPHLCFGSKKIFKQQFEIEKENNLTKLKTKKDWDRVWFESRNKSFLSVGSSDETAGNMNCQLTVIDENHTKNNIFALKVNIYSKEEKLNNRYLQFKIKVHNDVKNYLVNLLNANQNKINEKVNKKSTSKDNKEDSVDTKNKENNTVLQQALTFRFYRNYKKTNKPNKSKFNHFNDYEIFISLDKSKQTPKTISSKLLGCIGIDINANHVSMSEVDRYGNLVMTKDIDLNLTGKTTEQSSHLIALTVKEITNYAVSVNKPIVVEDLNFNQKKATLKSGFNKQYNTMLSSFAYGKILELIKSRGFDKGIEVIEVNPAYTSKIGKYKYQGLYKITTHQAASLVIARRGLFSYEKTVKIKAKEKNKENNTNNKDINNTVMKDKVITIIHKEKTISNQRSKHYPFELPVRNIQRKNNVYWREVEQNDIKAKKNRLKLKNKNLNLAKQDLASETSQVVCCSGEKSLKSTVALNPNLDLPF